MPTPTDRPWIQAYAEGVPADIPDVRETLVEMFEQGVRQHARRPALEFFGRETDYRELGRAVRRAAAGLRKLGVSHGDRVAIALPNCPQHVVAFYAVLRLGAIVVEHNPLYTAPELRHQFEDHGAEFAIVWDKLADLVAGFDEDVRPEEVIAVDVSAALPFAKRVALRLPLPKARAARRALTARPRAKGVRSWDDVVDARPLASRHPRPAVDDVAVLVYTSGTSGSPKAAMLTHRNLRANAMQGRAWVPGLQPGREVFYAVLPFFHAYGLTLCLTTAVSLGARIVLFPRFDLQQVLDAMRRTPATFLPAVPPIYDALAAAAEERDDVDLASIAFGISGAMSLPVATVERWERATGGLLVEGYGMTESSPIAIGNPMGSTRRPGTVGVPFPSTRIRVVDRDDPSVDVEPGEPGELLLQGPQVFGGYWNRPDETAAALLPGGWLRTGDIVTVDGDGYVSIVDRAKELIVTGGFNVSPSEVEHVLLAHPDIVGVAVVGVPGETGGEEVAAAVELRPGATLDVAGVREFARRSLAGYKVPKRFEVVEELPRSLIGKVLRRQVRDAMTR